EAARMVWARVVGNDATVALAAALGELELNVMMPVIAEALLESLVLLGRVARALGEKCVAGLSADEERCRELVARSAALVTALAPLVGYDRAAEVAKRAEREKRSVREVALEMKLADEATLDRVLDLRRLTEPGEPG